MDTWVLLKSRLQSSSCQIGYFNCNLLQLIILLNILASWHTTVSLCICIKMRYGGIVWKCLGTNLTLSKKMYGKGAMWLQLVSFRTELQRSALLLKGDGILTPVACILQHSVQTPNISASLKLTLYVIQRNLVCHRAILAVAHQ